MTIPRLFGPYGSAALAQIDTLAAYGANACWFKVPAPDLQQSCFCRACIATFCEHTGIDAPAPPEILARYSAAWTHHKCTRIAAFAAHYAQIIRTALPDCVIGAYMCPWTPE